MSKNFTKLLTASAACVLLSAGVSPLANATPWTVTSTGTIASGTDTTGVFGSIGDLTGQSFTQSITVDPSSYSSLASNSYYNNAGGWLGGTATDTVTVNNVTKTFTWDFSLFHSDWGQSFLANGVTHGTGVYDWVQSYEEGNVAGGNYVYATNGTYSNTNAYNVGLNFDQNWSRDTQAGDNTFSQFSVSGSAVANFSGSVATTSINSPVAAVPEPGTYALLMAGLGLFGFTARRRKNDGKLTGRVENRFSPALPHQTVRAVLRAFALRQNACLPRFPHTAFRCSSH